MASRDVATKLSGFELLEQQDLIHGQPGSRSGMVALKKCVGAAWRHLYGQKSTKNVTLSDAVSTKWLIGKGRFLNLKTVRFFKSSEYHKI